MFSSSTNLTRWIQVNLQWHTSNDEVRSLLAELVGSLVDGLDCCLTHCQTCLIADCMIGPTITRCLYKGLCQHYLHAVQRRNASGVTTSSCSVASTTKESQSTWLDVWGKTQILLSLFLKSSQICTFSKSAYSSLDRHHWNLSWIVPHKQSSLPPIGVLSAAFF